MLQLATGQQLHMTVRTKQIKPYVFHHVYLKLIKHAGMRPIQIPLPTPKLQSELGSRRVHASLSVQLTHTSVIITRLKGNMASETLVDEGLQ